MPRTKARLYSWKEITLSLVEGGLVAKGDEIGLLLLGRLIGLISDFGRVNSLGRFELPSSYYYHFMGFSIFHFWEKGKFYLYNMWRKPHHFLSTQVNKASWINFHSKLIKLRFYENVFDNINFQLYLKLLREEEKICRYISNNCQNPQFMCHKL